jgi:hypothetical protein
MKYLTPKLLLRFRSHDPDLADRATDEWEDALARYGRYYNRIKGKLPAAVRRFHDECCLHDADVFAPALISPKGRNGRRELEIVTQNINTLYAEHLNTLITLRYALAGDPVIRTPAGTEDFGQSRPQWLYDEWSLVRRGVFCHDILLSNGQVISTRFRQFQYQIAPLVLPAERGKAVSKVKKKAVPA